MKREHSRVTTSTTVQAALKTTGEKKASTVCILPELSFGNVPLAANITETLATYLPQASQHLGRT